MVSSVLLSLASVSSGCQKWNLLGHVISTEGVSVDPQMIETVMFWNRPSSVFEFRSFSGSTSIGASSGIPPGLLRRSRG